MGKSSLEVFVIATMVVVVVASNYLIQSSEAQTSHVVGGTMGWIIPTSGNEDAYTSWAANQTFVVGDVLVKEDAFDDCNATSPISISLIGPTNITLNTTGEHFFICTFGTHCKLGQKVAINVSTTATSSPSPPATTAAPPPPSKSSPLVTATAWPVTLLFIAMTLLL
ncbi:Umecyanin like [Actinidia chinensis var. chinensis]|uniref:Umecyanin like n=1 Tax=Actinidia chinensis var. chinensis TaxID=1590841 RepID=A0A2R6R4I8_ACTCC|nr:Umecyanin like [Actinidia chinensis var. chinensis]